MVAFENKILNNPIMTVFLKHEGLTAGVPGGAITFGGLDENNCESDVNYVSIIDPNGHFNFLLDGVQIGVSKGDKKILRKHSTTFNKYLELHKQSNGRDHLRYREFDFVCSESNRR